MHERRRERQLKLLIKSKTIYAHGIACVYVYILDIIHYILKFVIMINIMLRVNYKFKLF